MGTHLSVLFSDKASNSWLGSLLILIHSSYLQIRQWPVSAYRALETCLSFLDKQMWKEILHKMQEHNSCFEKYNALRRYKRHIKRQKFNQDQIPVLFNEFHHD